MPQTQQSFASLWLPRTGWFAAALLAVLLGALILIEVSRTVAALTTSPSHTPAPDPGESPTELLNRINRAHLFGVATGSAGEQSRRQLPETSLQLTLRGAFAGTDAAGGSAIIEVRGAGTRTVRVGGSVDRDTRLRGVHPDHVVLERAGQLESLYFPERSDIVSAAGSGPRADGRSLEALLDSGNQVNRRTPSETVAATGGDSPVASASDMSAEQRREMIRQRLQELRERAASNRNIQ